MALLQQIRSLTPPQRRAFTACFLGWTLDAFDFFILTFCLDAVVSEFHLSLKTAAEAVFWTLVMRPVGALVFGWLAERLGRRPTLMLNIICFSVFELSSAFAPTWTVFLVSRALFGIAMGGEWGVGAALAMETLPAESRGFFSGLLQEGYAAGQLMAAAVYGLVGLIVVALHLHGFAASWRLLFVIGALPSLLVFYINSKVEESPAWKSSVRGQRSIGKGPIEKPPAFLPQLMKYIPQLLFLTLLMFAFQSFSHGTQDLYPTFLKQHAGFTHSMVSLISIVGSFGAFTGGIICGALSEKFGRKRTVIATSLLAVLVVPLWAWSQTAAMLALGGFLMQFMVQGAWGIIPAHLNELSPAPMRSVLPGLAYTLGAFLSARNIVFQTAIATRFFGGRLAPAMAVTILIIAFGVAIVTAFGPEAKGADLTTA